MPNRIRKESESAMAAALKTGLYGSAAARSMIHFGPQIFPLHPTTLPVLVRNAPLWPERTIDLQLHLVSGAAGTAEVTHVAVFPSQAITGSPTCSIM